MARRRRDPDDSIRKNAAFRHQRELRKWSREDLANWANQLAWNWGQEGTFTGDSIYRIEEEDSVPVDWKREVFCTLFGTRDQPMPPEELGFPSPPAVLQQTGTPRGVPSAVDSLHASPPDLSAAVGSVLNLLDSNDEMNRSRRAFAAYLALAGGGAVTGRLDLERLAAVLAGAPLDEKALDDLEVLTHDLIHQEAALSAGSLLPAVRGHLEGIASLLIRPASPRAYSIAAQTALLAGYLAFKLQRLAVADTCWSLAIEFGAMAGDTRVQAAVALLQGWRWGAEDGAGDHVRAISLLNGAEPLVGDPAMAAALFTYRASEHAKASESDGSHIVLALRDIEQAEKHLSRMPRDERLYILESVRGESVSVRGKSFAYLGRPHDAAADLKNVLASVPAGSLSWRSDVTVNLAAVQTKMDAPDSAAELLGDALRLAVTASAPRCIERVRKYRTRWLAGFDALPAVRRLDEQIRELAPSSSPRLLSGQ